MIELIYPVQPAPAYPGCVRAGNTEMLPVVDSLGNVIAQADRRFCHSGSRVLHPVVHLHIIDRRGELYLQQRAASKDLLPLCWDTAVGGHVSYGEYIFEALFRESGEELGLAEYKPHWIDSYIFGSDTERELVNVFAAVGDFNLVPDPEELADGRFWTFSQIDGAMGKGILTPNFEQEFTRIRTSLPALL